MKRLLMLILCLLMLCGCGTAEEAPATSPEMPEAPAAAEPGGLYDPESSLEAITGGSMKVFPLSRTDTMTVIPFGDSLLLFNTSATTTLTKLTGETLRLDAELALELSIDAADPAVQVSEKGVTYYDSNANNLVFLDTGLREVRRVDLPENLTGQPALSADRKTIYYFTADALRSIDLDSGIDRMVRQTAFQFQSATALHCADTVLECTILDGDSTRQMFLSTATGALLYETENRVTLSTNGDCWFALYQDGIYEEKLTGTGTGDVRMLYLPEHEANAFPLLAQNAVAIATATDSQVTLDYYNLSDGTHPYSVTLPEGFCPSLLIADPGQTCIWMVLYDPDYSCDVICRWDYENNLIADDTVYIGDRRTAENPDTYGLDSCKDLAARISETHDVQILIWEDAAVLEPVGYSLTAEHHTGLIDDALNRLDTALGNFPTGFLKEAASELGDGILRIALVREISKNDGFDPDGVFFQAQDGNPYVWLEIDGYDMEGTLYHELFHLIESRIFSKSLALDDWEKLNPEGFSYAYSYLYDTERSDRTLIEGNTRTFIDFYSMTFPREDRASVMQYAMLEGTSVCFSSEIMQRKLRAICTGIREAYGLEDSESPLLWEQYLSEPIR